MAEDNQPVKPWFLRILDESEQIIPASLLGIIGVAAFIAVFWLLTTTQGRNVLSRFTPTAPEAERHTPEGEAKYKAALLAALVQGSAEPLSDEQKRTALKSFAERVDSGEEKILSVEEKEKILASLQRAQ